MTKTLTEICSRCSREIGGGEPAHVLNGAVICGVCKAILARPDSPAAGRVRKPYPGLQALSTLLTICGIVELIAGVALGIVILGRDQEAVPLAIACFSGGLIACIALCGFGQLLSCFRDIAVDVAIMARKAREQSER